jgi:hypothetical protein
MSISNGRVYQVVLSGQASDQLKELYRRIKEKEHRTRILSAVKRIVAFLSVQPLRFGEPRFTLQDLNLEVRVGAVQPVVVMYGVHTERRLVFLRDFRLLEGPQFQFP